MIKRILVIDDSPTLRKILKHFLTKKGYFVSEANNGKRGLEFIFQEDFDLIILDMMMPVMDGINVLKELRNKKDFNTPIMILSADKDKEKVNLGLDLGAKYYMYKPFNPRDIVEKIENIFNKN